MSMTIRPNGQYCEIIAVSTDEKAEKTGSIYITQIEPKTLRAGIEVWIPYSFAMYLFQNLPAAENPAAAELVHSLAELPLDNLLQKRFDLGAKYDWTGNDWHNNEHCYRYLCEIAAKDRGLESYSPPSEEDFLLDIAYGIHSGYNLYSAHLMLITVRDIHKLFQSILGINKYAEDSSTPQNNGLEECSLAASSSEAAAPPTEEIATRRTPIIEEDAFRKMISKLEGLIQERVPESKISLELTTNLSEVHKKFRIPLFYGDEYFEIFMKYTVETEGKTKVSYIHLSPSHSPVQILQPLPYRLRNVVLKNTMISTFTSHLPQKSEGTNEAS